MLTTVLTEIFTRDLNLLKKELEMYPSETDLWTTEGAIANSGGNLALHLIGNLKHFIGATLGQTDFVRDRDKEFSSSSVSRQHLLEEIDATAVVVSATLAKLSTDDLSATFPIEVFGRPLTTEFFLVHLATHLNYHLGQVNYHRRILSKIPPEPSNLLTSFK